MPKAARSAEESDPAKNEPFAKRWSEPAHGLTPAEFDRLADTELFFGRERAAEHYSRRAAELRLTGGDRQPQRVPR